jgi:hypothetical protein
LFFSAYYHSVGLTFDARWASISIILAFLAFDLAWAASACSLARLFVYLIYSAV